MNGFAIDRMGASGLGVHSVRPAPQNPCAVLVD
jgi:hypothetical protein